VRYLTKDPLRIRRSEFHWNRPIQNIGTVYGGPRKMNNKKDEGNEIGISISFNLKDPEAEEFIAKNPIKIRDAYRLNFNQGDLATIQNLIRDQILYGFLHGETVQEAGERIKEELADLSKITLEQAITIARTELLGAANYSRYIALNNSGFSKKKWLTAMDERVRPLHREMNGKIINVGNLWVFPDGNTVRYPCDYKGPDHLVVNCRCIEVVVPGSHYLEVKK
jgi:SPP1 gp7 family putative phage head morphogenesis protein